MRAGLTSREVRERLAVRRGAPTGVFRPELTETERTYLRLVADDRLGAWRTCGNSYPKGATGEQRSAHHAWIWSNPVATVEQAAARFPTTWLLRERVDGHLEALCAAHLRLPCDWPARRAPGSLLAATPSLLYRAFLGLVTPGKVAGYDRACLEAAFNAACAT